MGSSGLKSFSNDLTIEIVHVDHIIFEENVIHEDIISPFTRLYFVKKGKSKLVIAGVEYLLEENKLYVIPSFTQCSYYFEKGMDHIFIHCILSLQQTVNPFFYLQTQSGVQASELDQMLFERLLKLHPHRRLPDYHPRVYHRTMWDQKFNHYDNSILNLESDGIVKQIFSRFIIDKAIKPLQSLNRYNIDNIFFYIREHLDSDIDLQDLAQIACVTPDHFSKVFKACMGIGPKEYIIRERLQKAQLLLLTTDMPIKEILNYINFKSSAYFTRIFTKYNGINPSDYRRRKLNY